ncbi:3'-5' exonuclease [Patescibacteria group bacterium]|nr:3'-5' exonuclease [Patescibacteria group bacterium]
MGMKFNLGNMLFFDIECVPQQSSFYDLDDGMKALWERKVSGARRNPQDGEEIKADESYENRSGIYAEFGKIIVVSVGYFTKTGDGSRQFHVKSFAGDDERKVISSFFELLNTSYDKTFHLLCGHNIKEFDIPYICRRALVNGLDLPTILDLNGKKPREVNHVDTLELWKFGDRKSFTSLDLLCRVMGIETPKDDISGEQVSRVYRDDKDLPRIKTYCEKDVVATAKLLLKFTK